MSVAEGEQVVVFNQDDSQWYWVVKHKTDNSEGFVPSNILKEITSTTPTPKHSIGETVCVCMSCMHFRLSFFGHIIPLGVYVINYCVYT